VLFGSKVSPVPTHQVPEMTAKNRSWGWKCGRLMLPGSHLMRHVRPGLARIAEQHGLLRGAGRVAHPLDVGRGREVDRGAVEVG
jgi:hypothetical protein